MLEDRLKIQNNYDWSNVCESMENRFSKIIISI